MLVSFRFDAQCQNDCCGDVDCAGCSVEVGIGTSSTTDPGDVADLLDLAQLLTLFQDYVISGDIQDVVNALNNLVGNLGGARPYVFVKVTWEECHFQTCGLFCMYNESECQNTGGTTPEWTYVPGPLFDGAWLPLNTMDQWPAIDLQNLANAIKNAGKNGCPYNLRGI